MVHLNRLDLHLHPCFYDTLSGFPIFDKFKDRVPLICVIRSGIQMRRSSWQDGVLGTNCPIPPKWNWTYQFQVKDQIGSFFYYPSLNMQRASGGFGPFIITNRNIIPLPFNTPDGDIVIMIGDWYTRNYTVGTHMLFPLC